MVTHLALLFSTLAAWPAVCRENIFSLLPDPLLSELQKEMLSVSTPKAGREALEKAPQRTTPLARRLEHLLGGEAERPEAL